MDRTVNGSSLPNERRTYLPAVLSSFVGRKRELADLAHLIPSNRLVSLTGAAGCGKTRLALHVASAIERHYPDGVVWVELAQLADPALVPKTVARAVQVAEQPDRSTTDILVDALCDRDLLLALDNCEHVLAECAPLVERLLADTEIRVLATSREPLKIAGEMRYPVPPLALPSSDTSLNDLGQFDAIQLFVERARATLPAFSLTADNAGLVVSICRHLDGIALAIELASARVNVLTLEQITERLDDRFGLLRVSSVVTRSRHETLRSAIDWSHDLLTNEEQTILRRLSVFASGCSLSSAEAVCAGGGVERRQVLDLIASLVNKSLIVAHTLHPGEARYSLLETIRHYGQEKLRASDEWSEIHDRHLDWFLRLAEETAPKLAGPYQELWLDWLETEHDNIRAALSWALESGQIEPGLRMMIALYQFLTIRDLVDEGLAWFDRLLTRAGDNVSLLIRANALAYAAFMSGFRGNVTAQIAHARKAVNIAERAGDEGKRALAWALAAQAHGARAAGDFETEFAIAKRAIQLHRESEDSYLMGVSLSTYSTIPMLLGDYATAHEMLDEALPLLRQLEDPYRIAMALNFSGDLARCEQKYSRAVALYEESVSLLRKHHAVRDLASVLHNFGHARLHMGDAKPARDDFNESMELHKSQRNRRGMAECLIGFAALAIATGLPGTGLRLLATAVSIGGPSIASAWPATRMEYEHYLALARAKLTERELQTEWASGRSLTLEQAVEAARNIPLSASARHRSRGHPDDLTVREREITELIALGKSNQRIADELVISKRTVEKHIANILAKLQVSNRAGIVRWVLESATTTSSE